MIEYAAKFMAHAWKVCVLSKVPWVRIPLSPPKIIKKLNLGVSFEKYLYFFFFIKLALITNVNLSNQNRLIC